MTLSGVELRQRPMAPAPWLIGAIGLAIVGAVVLRVLAAASWDPTVFVAFGEADERITGYAESVLGRGVVVRSALGHDGKFFFVQAIDPWLTEQELLTELLDRPAYRAQRMLFPVLVGFVGLADTAILPWSMLAVNLLAVAFGGWATARLALAMGGSPWLGLSFAANIGLISDVMVGGAGVVALAFAILAVLAVENRALALAAVWLTLAALSREIMLLFAVGAAVLAIRRLGRRAIWLVAGPFAAVAGWAIYVRVRLGGDTVANDIGDLGVWPLGGIINSLPSWIDSPLDGLTGVATLAVGAVLSIRALRTPSYIGWASIGFFAMSLLLSELVWERYFDISRAVAPIFTA